MRSYNLSVLQELHSRNGQDPAHIAMLKFNK